MAQPRCGCCPAHTDGAACGTFLVGCVVLGLRLPGGRRPAWAKAGLGLAVVLPPLLLACSCCWGAGPGGPF